MPVKIARFETLSRKTGVVPTSLKDTTKHGTIRFAEAHHLASPDFKPGGVIQSGWKTLWFMDRGGADYYGVLWFGTDTFQTARFNAAKADANQFIKDNVQTGRYR